MKRFRHRAFRNGCDAKPHPPSKRAVYLAWRDALPVATQEQPCEGRLHPRNRWTIEGRDGVWGRLYEMGPYGPDDQAMGEGILARYVDRLGHTRVRAFVQIRRAT